MVNTILGKQYSSSVVTPMGIEVTLQIGPGLNPNNLTVKATLYYQSIPPYFLNDRFSQAPNEPATQRLYYLTSNLQTKGTAIENWKFAIASGSQSVSIR